MSAVASGAGFRADIQGLRAVAVVLVVADHVFDWPSGGFVGVDVFYVISGYLITSLLWRELDQTGSISIRGFYARRIRRIFPVALVVLTVTVILAFALWYVPRALQTALDAFSAALFVSNWHFMAIGTDYLQAEGAVSPLQHFWSLSIEEQFYTMWPLALLAIALLLRRSRRAITVLVVIAIALSVLWSAHQTAVDPEPAYFDTFGRAWELLVGALIALLGAASNRISMLARRATSLCGIVLIVLSAIFISADLPVPFPSVTPAVLGSAAVIWANFTATPRSLLGNVPVQWLGRISYSLYLWHFPVIIFAVSVLGNHWWVALASIPVMLLLSELSFRFVEQRVLKSSFLAKASRTRNSRIILPRDVLLGVGILALIFVLSVTQTNGPGSLRSAAELASHLRVKHSTSESPALSARFRSHQVQEALSSTTWPAPVRAQLNSLYSSQQGPAMLESSPGCRNSVFQPGKPRICTYGSVDAKTTVMVVGDSVALSWVPTVERVAQVNDWRVISVGFANCSLIDVSVTNRDGTDQFRKACATSRQLMTKIIDAQAPDMVFLSAAESSLQYTGLAAKPAALAWQAGVERTLRSLAAVPRVVILSNPPETEDPNSCASRVASPLACVTNVSATYRAKAKAERRAAHLDSDHALYVDTESWFCVAARCPAYVGAQVLKTDGSHLTEAAAQAVAPLLQTALDG